MSWSNSWIGTRTGIKNAIVKFSDQLSGMSKEEFDAAKPHLEALLDQNNSSDGDPVMILHASGHGYKSNDKSYNNVTVDLKSVGKLCE